MSYQLVPPRLPQQNLTAVERVLTNRGIALEDIPHYLSTTDDDILDPKLIAYINDGARMLVKHIYSNDKVLIQVDSDCDGMTSAALLINYLNCLFPAFVQNNILYRMHEGKQHGLIEKIIPYCIDNNVGLVIAPDASSNDYEMHKVLKEHGIDVLVIDHHEADKISEYACVINNQLCDYPTKSLSGVAMVWKYCCYLDAVMGCDYAQQFLDLVSVGLIADMMDLRDFETKHLVNKGLKQIRNPYLKGMVAKQDYSISKGGGLNPHTVGFYIAPFVNAITRMGTQDEKLMVFEAMLDFKGYEQIPSTKRGCKGQVETRVEQACRTCTNVKNRQNKSIDSSLEIIEYVIKEKNLLENKILALKLEPQFAVDKNIAGLVANKLASEYQRPTLMLNKVIQEDGSITWEGSARGYDKSAFKDFRAFMENCGFALYAQGHANAFGTGIRDEDFADFIEYSNKELKDYDFTPVLSVDIIWDANDFNNNDILKLAELESIWGQGVEKPLVAIENIKVHSGDLKLMKETTLKISLTNGTDLIKFGSNQEEYDKLYSDLGCVTINVVGECKANVWNGLISPQIEIKEYDIVGTTEYYF